MPLVFHAKTLGVLEIGSVEEISYYKIVFLERVSEIIAAAIYNEKNTNNIYAVLNEAQRLSQEIQEQDQELKENLLKNQKEKENWEKLEKEYKEKIELLSKNIQNQ
jgi:hypothetical protein